MAIPDLLERLLTTPGPSGQERVAAAVWRAAAASVGRGLTPLGDDGLAALRPVGGFDPHGMLGQRVDVLARGGAVPGVVASRSQKRKRGEDRKALDYDDLFLDVGAKDGDELKGLVRPGDALVWQGAPLALRGGRFASRSFDNRIGCYVALEAARRIGENGGAAGDVIAVAAVQEEVGDFAGSRTTPFRILAD